MWHDKVGAMLARQVDIIVVPHRHAGQVPSEFALPSLSRSPYRMPPAQH